MRLFKTLLAVLVFAIAPSGLLFGQNSSIKNLKIEEYTLPNGLKVVLNEDHSVSRVFGEVVVKAGGMHDPKDATGMAHYQEHMLFKGTTKLGTLNWEKEKIHIQNIFRLYDELGKAKDDSERKRIQKEINRESVEANKYAINNEFSSVTHAMGGTNMNANTGEDRTVYFNSFPPNQVEKWLELNSHRFDDAVFRGFQAELEVVYEEKNMYDESFFSRILENFNKEFYKKHPYGQQTIIGTKDDLKNPSLTKMYEFYKTYYVANNMVLILTGDFNTDEVKPLIEKTFGQLENRPLPEKEEYKEEPFNGREFVKVKMSPIAVGILGFRTINNGHPDEYGMKILNQVLSNENETGLLNQLIIDNKIMIAMALDFNYNEYGGSFIIFAPKIIGQSLNKAEALVLEQLKRLKSGDFDESLIETAKKQLYTQIATSLESIEGKGEYIGEIVAQGRSANEVNEFSNKIEGIDKAKIIELANKYYTDNFIAFHSKMGFPKNNPIEKPGFEPLKTKQNAKSDYAKFLESIPVKEANSIAIDFNESSKEININSLTKLHVSENKINDIFSLSIRFDYGNKEDKNIGIAASIMNYCGTESKSLKELKKSFSEIGCQYSVSASKYYTTVYVSGLEKNLEKAVTLINSLINNAKVSDSDVDNVISQLRSERKMEAKEPAQKAMILVNYVIAGEKSQYLTRLSKKEIKRFDAKKTKVAFDKAIKYSANIFYCGTKPVAEVESVIKNNLTLNNSIKGIGLKYEEMLSYDKNIIFFLHHKKALQSNIYLYMTSNNRTKDTDPYVDAFNTYFDGGFSGIVLQEIRESRSLAYSAWASVIQPDFNNKPNFLLGNVATQTDKTFEALDVFNDLIRNMPEKPERIDMIKKYLIGSTISNNPHFREISESIEDWKRRGYSNNPADDKIKVYEDMKFDDIVKFYKENIKDKPYVTIIVGDKKKVDMKKLSEYGEVKILKLKNIYKK